MRNYKATVPIIQGADTIYEYPCFVAWFLHTVPIFDSYSLVVSLLCVR